MSQELRTELDRIADSAPPVRVPADTWSKARAARQRARAAGAAAVVVVIVTIAAVSLMAPGRGELDPAGDATLVDLALPDRIEALPSRLTGSTNGDEFASDIVSEVMPPGRAAAAFLADGQLPVIIDAATGAYRAVDPPGWPLPNALLRSCCGPGLALSPDGSQLAYAWADRATATEPVPSGVKVANLLTGEIRTIPIVGEEGTLVETIAWSPDSRWIAWTGDQHGTWTEGSIGDSEATAGRIGPASQFSEQVPRQESSSDTISVANDGTVAISASNRIFLWNEEPVARLPITAGQVPTRAVFDESGQQLAVGFSQSFQDDGDGQIRDSGSIIRLTDGRATTFGSETTDSQPVGWLGNQPILLVETQGLRRALVLSTQDGPDPQISLVEAGVPTSLTVATDLITQDVLSVERPGPDWPTAPEAIATRVGALLLLSVFAYAAIKHNRRRRRLARAAE